MSKIVYPLQDVLNVKNKRVRDAELELAKRREELKREEEKLEERQKALDEVKEHLNDKYRQLRLEFDGGTTTHKIEQIRNYIKVVLERLAQEQKRFDEQKAVVTSCEQKVQEAKQALLARRKEVDKIEEHKQNFLMQARILLAEEEAKEQDEIGNIVYTLHQRKRGKHG